MNSIVQKVRGRAIALPGDDIDTDRIIPARFMRSTVFDGLGKYVFHDERFDENGSPKEHPFNNPRFSGATILLTGKNFGCGSSREHAPQALKRFGISALIGLSFADIFAGNCVSLGMPAVTVGSGDLDELVQITNEEPFAQIEIDIKAERIEIGTRTFPLSIDEAARNAFLLGLWDTTSLLLGNADAIHATARRLLYVNNFRSLSGE